MANDRLATWLTSLKEHPVRTGMALTAVLVLAGLGFLLVRFDFSLTLMLPEDSQTLETITFLRDTDISGKIVLSLRRTDPSVSQDEFHQAIDDLAASLDSPLIQRVTTGFKQEDVIKEMGAFLRRAPELIDEADLKAIEERLTDAEIAKAVRGKYKELLKPQGAFMLQGIRSDPLDIRMDIIYRIRDLATSLGYEVQVENGHILSRDGDHAMIIIHTDVKFTDSLKSKELFDFLEARRAELPGWAELDIVSGHYHTVSNERTIKRDIRVTLAIVTVAFVLLFVFYFRDLRAGLVFAIPMVAVVLAIGICAVIMRVMSPMSIGFGSVIAGIAVDYGIHIYIAVKRCPDAATAVRKVTRPIVLGALTTSGVFVAFVFSDIPGYRQLAWLALLSIVFSVAAALLLLPAFIKPNTGPESSGWRLPQWSKKQAAIVAAISVIALAAMIPAFRFSHFESDMKVMDGTEKRFIEQEERFQKTWGKGEVGLAMVVMETRTEEEALQANDWLYREMTQRMPEEQVVSFSRIWKSADRRRGNLARWKEFWSKERIEDLRAKLVRAGAKYGFQDDAFSPFIQQLEAPPSEPEEVPRENRILAQLKGRFVQVQGDRVLAMTHFPDTKENLAVLKSLPESKYKPVIVSQRHISQTLTDDYTNEIAGVAILACILVVGSCALLLRNLRMTLVSLVPVIFGIVSIVAVIVLLDMPMTVVMLFAAIVIIGLCIDYGIFAVHAYAHGLEVGTCAAITLSAGTTLIGAATLLFAKHPALFSVGVTLLSGITGGYIASLVVVPALSKLVVRRKDEASS